jgi:hypothetical protein
MHLAVSSLALGVLPVEFAKFHNFHERDLASNKWIEGIEKSDNLSSKAKVEMRHCS